MTSLKTIKEQIYKFLASEKPEVMAITGDWGVGKTHAWETYLKEAQNKNRIKFNNYSYVSLFGINSIKELRFAIFQNSINKKIIGTNPNLDTFQKNVGHLVKNSGYLIEKVGKKTIPLIQEGASSYGLKGFAGQAIEAISYLSVSKTIICLDDFERTNLNVQDILGVISELKEKKNCKVILILNDSKLSEEDENVKKQFENHSEKVIDKKLKFKPTPEECSEITFDDKCDIPDKEFLKNNCVKLEITNIRIMNRIISLWQDLQICIVDTPEEVKEKIASSLVLSCGSFYKDNEEIPDIEFIKNHIPLHLLPSSNGKSENEAKELQDKKEKFEQQIEKLKKHEEMLTNYRGDSENENFDSYIGILDEKIFAFVENGYFDEQEMKDIIKRYVKKWDAMVEVNRKYAGYKTVWRNIFNRFDNDEQEIINSLYNEAKNCVGILSSGDLNGTLEFLRRFQADDKANDLINYYIEKIKNKEFFNLKDWGGIDIIDTRMEENFLKEYNRRKEKKNLDELFKLLEYKNLYNDNDNNIDALIMGSEDEYYKAFKNYEGRNLEKVIANCFASLHENNVETKKNIKKALRRLRDKNNLNKWRFKRWNF